MQQILQSILLELNCSSKEIKLYTACFELGSSNITTLAKKAKLQRSTTYLIAQQLVDKRLLYSNGQTYNTRYLAAPPDALARLLESRKRAVGKAILKLQDHTDKLLLAYGSSDVLPRVTALQGRSGLVAALEKILSARTEILLWTNQRSERSIFKQIDHDYFVQSRIERQLPIRVLSVDNPEGLLLLESDSNSYRKSRMLPPETQFSAETYIFDNTVITIDFTAEVIVIIIENPSVYHTHQAIFETTWKSLDK